MKNLILLIAVLLLCSFSFDINTNVVEKPGLVSVILVGLYELAVRIIPTVKDYTIVGKIIKGLKWLHLFLNNQKH
jgi:hypothetical protein